MADVACAFVEIVLHATAFRVSVVAGDAGIGTVKYTFSLKSPVATLGGAYCVWWLVEPQVAGVPSQVQRRSTPPLFGKSEVLDSITTDPTSMLVPVVGVLRLPTVLTVDSWVLAPFQPPVLTT